MRNVIFVCAGLALVAMTAPVAFGQPPVPLRSSNTDAVKPRQPGGLLGDPLGTYLTIEGVRSEGTKIETDTLLVDTIDGKKLDKPISLVIHGATIVNHNLQPARLNLPAQQRCIIKGFESGQMIGVPPAISAAAKEQGWRDVPMSPVLWQWRPHFVALVVVEPKDLQLNGQQKTRSDQSPNSESLPVPEQLCAKLQALFEKHYPKARLDNQGVNGIHFEHQVTNFEFPYTGPKGAKHETEKQRGPMQGGILCSVYSRSGPYMGPLALMPASEGNVAQTVIDRKAYAQLLMAPYSQNSDVHLWVALSFPPDVDQAFLEKFRQIMKDFQKAAQ
jgi:hypothetical protein